MTAEQELKPCPFCGKQPELQSCTDESLFSHAQVMWWWVSCECEAETHHSEIKPDAITAWNTRLAPEPHPRIFKEPQ